MSSETANQLLTRVARRNFWCNIADASFFVFGLTLVSRYTVLPFFVAELSNAPLLLGLIPAIQSVGWLLPQLFTAPLVASLPRRKPFILLMTLFERLPFLAMGIILLVGAAWPAWALLLAFFICYTIHAVSSGLTATAWQDFIGRLISGQRWGIFFGLSNALGGVLGIVGAAIVGVVLAQQPFPQNVGLLALSCFAVMVISFMFLAATIEPPQPTTPRPPLLIYLRGLIPLLRNDHAFRSYLFSRAAIALSFTGHNFITAAALLRFNVPPELLASFTAALLASHAIGDLLLGVLADRWGHKQILEVATVVGIASILLAMLAPEPFWFVIVFVLAGIAQAGYQLSGFTLVLAFSNESNRPTYIGLANTALAPVAGLGPLLIAQIAQSVSYAALFAVCALIGLIGWVILHRAVPAVAPQPAKLSSD